MKVLGDGERRVEVALPLPVLQTFTYGVPAPEPAPGTRVLVPFRREEKIGWVVGPAGEEDVPGLRGALDVLEETPSASPEILALSRWMAEYYLAPLGIVLKGALPSALSDTSRDYLTLASDWDGNGTPREERLVSALKQAGTPGRVRTLRKTLGMGSLWPEIRKLTARGIIRHDTLPPRGPPVRTQRVVRIVSWLSSLADREERFSRAPRQRDAYEMVESSGGSVELAHLLKEGGLSRSVVAGLVEKGVVEVVEEEVLRDPFRDRPPADPRPLVPTGDQRRVLDALLRGWRETKPLPALLHGVTGSGKTLVYIELLKEVVQKGGRGAIILVPEISLTPQTVSRFRAHFGDQVAVLHSALSDGERFDAWRQIRNGEKKIAVGARSAIFAPVRDLGVVVVDEEHDGSYKQSEGPRYHARDVAVVRAAREGAVCVLGSATPSLESWQNAQIGKFTLLTLPNRVGGGALPPVEVVDLKEVWRKRRERRGGPSEEQGKGGEDPQEGGGVLAPRLVTAIRNRLLRKEQVILLLNRRGYSNFVQCRECGEVWRCPDCSVSLTYHRLTSRILCHYCRHEEPAPSRCSRCGSEDLTFRGLGTEQVERVVAETFPGARIARMDVDTTSGKWSHHEILGRFGQGQLDILLGTQMIAKGLDFPRVTLVGVVNADVGIHLPDFRASERTFQLLSQVAGRTGRGPLGGEVLVQTSLPDHYSVRAALDHDFVSFAQREIQERISPPYPPHVRLANILMSSPRAEEAAREAERGVAWLRSHLNRSPGGVELVGPAPAPIEKLHGRWRWHFILRCPSPAALGSALRAFRDGFQVKGQDVRVVIDRDPVALL